MNETNPRRQFLKLTGAAAGLGMLVTALPRHARADELPHVPETDPTASALGYREDASKVDDAKYPTHKAGLLCSNCQFFGGTDKTSWAACQLFPGKAVSAKGWCSGYNAKK
ncbi:MAG: high-potential iron-sulfur protein [Rudaea sp.]|nr:high-potential iron-sulfur protein [Rudaea sp.]